MGLYKIKETMLPNIDLVDFSTQLREYRRVAKLLGVKIPRLRGTNHSFRTMDGMHYEIWIDGLGDGGPVYSQYAESTAECRVGYIQQLIEEHCDCGVCDSCNALVAEALSNKVS